MAKSRKFNSKRYTKRLYKKKRYKTKKRKYKTNKRKYKTNKRKIIKKIGGSSQREIEDPIILFDIEFIRHGPSLSNVMTKAQAKMDESMRMESVSQPKRVAARSKGMNADLNHFIKDVSLCHFGISCAIDAMSNYRHLEGTDIVLCSCMLRAIQTAMFLFPNKRILIVPFINEEAKAGVERDMTGYARSPYEPISVVKKRVERTKEILTNPELIHFGGDQYTLDKIKKWKEDNRVEGFNFDFSIFEESEKHAETSGLDRSFLFKSNPEKFFNLFKGLIDKGYITNGRVACVTHGYTLRNNDPNEGLIAYMKTKGAVDKPELTELTDNEHNNVPNCGSIAVEGKYNPDNSVAIEDIQLNIGMKNKDNTPNTPNVYGNLEIQYKVTGELENGARKCVVQYNVNDNKHGVRGEDELPKFKDYVNTVGPENVASETFFCYHFMHLHDDLTGQYSPSVADCCSPTEYYLKYCLGDNERSFLDLDFILKQDSNDNLQLYSSETRERGDLNHNFELLEGSKKRRLLFFMVTQDDRPMDHSSSINHGYLLPGIGLYDRIFDGIRGDNTPQEYKESLSDNYEFIKSVVDALCGGSYDRSRDNIFMYFTKAV